MRLLIPTGALILFVLSSGACAVDTAPPPGDAWGDVRVSSMTADDGAVSSQVVTNDGETVVALRYSPSTNLITVMVQGEDPISFESPSYGATTEGAKLAAWDIYRRAGGFHDEPGCDPPANFMTTVCFSHMCALHDMCYFNNPDPSNPCHGTGSGWWQSFKNWAWGTPDYCDTCNINAVSETLKNGMYGCEVSGECESWDCGCDAKQCTVDGQTVCSADADCHTFKNSEP